MAQRVNYVGPSGEVQASTYTPEDWSRVPGGSVITAIRYGDWVASEREVVSRPVEMNVQSQAFAADGTFRIEMHLSTV